MFLAKIQEIKIQKEKKIWFNYFLSHNFRQLLRIAISKLLSVFNFGHIGTKELSMADLSQIFMFWLPSPFVTPLYRLTTELKYL